MIAPKPHGNAIPETEVRARILRALALLALEGTVPTFARMRAAGMSGQDAKIRHTIEDMRACGEIPAHVLPARQGQIDDPVAVISAQDRARVPGSDADHEAAARERSAEWVAEHDARMRRLRRRSRREAVASERWAVNTGRGKKK